MDKCVLWTIAGDKIVKKCPQVYDLQAENERLKEQVLKPCVTCNAFNENDRLKEALQEISDTEDFRLAAGSGYDINIDTLAKKAMKG